MDVGRGSQGSCSLQLLRVSLYFWLLAHSPPLPPTPPSEQWYPGDSSLGPDLD